jgi:hypothetical protein
VQKTSHRHGDLPAFFYRRLKPTRLRQCHPVVTDGDHLNDAFPRHIPTIIMTLSEGVNNGPQAL